jgi:peptidoglycan/xylan/chitin deacetylase (PgdA/CDA1 family)
LPEHLFLSKYQEFAVYNGFPVRRQKSVPQASAFCLQSLFSLIQFFVVGRQIQRHPAMMRRIINEGHGAGNHTWSHPSLPGIMTNNVVAEVRNTQNELARVTGRRPDLFRPPYGAITRSDEQLLHELGFRQIFWSVDTLDWTGLSGEQILSIVRRDITPGGIILQHNIETSPDLLRGTVEALPRIIEELQAQGYKFVTVQTLLDQQ